MRVLLLLALAITVAACGSAVEPLATHTDFAAPAGLAALPTDGVQPWEQRDSRGLIIPPPRRKGVSAFSDAAYFQAGAERFLEGGSVTGNGDALRIDSDAGNLSYAIYRFPMGGVQPSAFALDVNLHGDDAEYWVATSDYGRNTWQWSGPFDDAQITKVVVAGSNNLSGSGTFFTAVVVMDEVTIDVVGITVSPENGADTTAPPTPAAPTGTSVVQGIELSWADVLAGDLAGYQVYWSYSPFSAISNNGVNKLGWLENTTRFVLPVPLARDVYVALSAVDTNGNASSLSPVAGPFRSQSGPRLNVGVTTPQVSLQLNDALQIMASGADLYDFDTDGDGVFDITGSASGVATVDTSSTGIIRPRVRAASSNGLAVAFGSVSLIVSGNQRPVANATATPSSGFVPLDADLDGSHSSDADGSIVEYAWDYGGDGLFDETFAAPTSSTTLMTEGLYNIKLRVTDDQGAFDIDTVSVHVLQNTISVIATPSDTSVGEVVTLTATLSKPAPLNWDLDGNGTFETTGTGNSITTSFDTPGLHRVGVHGSFGGGSPVEAQTIVHVNGWLVPSPLPAVGSPSNGMIPSMAIVGGRPAIAYYNSDLSQLTFIRSSDADGSAWDIPVNVLSLSANVTSCQLLVLVNGQPAIAYHDADVTSLNFVRASDTSGNAWEPPFMITGSGDVGHDLSAAVVNGNPAISFRDNTTLNSSDLLYVRAVNPDGSPWGPITTIDNLNDVGFGSSLAVIGGNPAVAYSDFGGELRYCRATNNIGSSWSATHQVDQVGTVNAQPSLVEVNGRPGISYFSTDINSAGALMFARSATVDGSGSFWSLMMLDSDGLDDSSLAIINGYPAICYRQSGGMLRYVRAVNANGSAWLAPEGVTGYALGSNMTLLEVNGKPAVTYTDVELTNVIVSLGYARRQ
jgi:hypothetical protein